MVSIWFLQTDTEQAQHPANQDGQEDGRQEICGLGLSQAQQVHGDAKQHQGTHTVHHGQGIDFHQEGLDKGSQQRKSALEYHHKRAGERGSGQKSS